MIVAITGLLTPVAFWLAFGLYDRFAPRPQQLPPHFMDMDRISPERRMEYQMLRQHLLEAARSGDWPLVRKQADDFCNTTCPPLIFPLQAEAYWRLGQRAKAAQLWAPTLAMDSPAGNADYLALLGDPERYKTHILSVLDHATPAIANDAAWACSLLPDILPDYAPVVALAEQAVQQAQNPTDKANSLNTLGVALYRAERFEEALLKLQESEKLSPEMINVVFSALCYHKLGQATQARLEANRYDAFLRSSLPTNNRIRHEYLLFEQELHRVLPPEKAPPSRPAQKATAQ
jgi:tetratricopeptide (TPR) repeat protein